MDRRGNMLGQIVVFVLGLVVVGGVVLFGASVLNDINDDRCEIARVQFATQLSTLFDRNRGKGTVKVAEVEVPCETVSVCFVDRQIIDGVLGGKTIDEVWPGQEWVDAPDDNIKEIIEGSVIALDPTNVFTIQVGGMVLPVERFSGFSAPIQVSREGSVEKSATCIRADNGVLRLWMRGTGSVVQVSDE